ncbi:MAG: RNA pseudouridine synthase [Bacteroidetes bacterium 4572_117]|nr:MAG: RNA pseudouridine synthase [Bacteroidetes bacterium 4572_117]
MQDTGENQLFEHFKYIVDKGQSPLRIDKYLFNKIENISRHRIQESAKTRNILVNEKAVKSNYKVRPDDVISIVFEYPPREIKIVAENIPLDIVYEDDELLLVNKPAGMVVHPSFGHYSGTLLNALAYHLRDNELFKSDEERPGLIHRIDKNTSGILLVAKTENAKVNLSKQFFDRTTERKYIALVWGNFDENEGTITGNIGRCLKNRKVMSVFPEGDLGKHAITHYKVIERYGYVTQIECKLETGRTHQIRAHMKYISHPLFNDEEYGGDKILKGTTFTKYKQFVQNCFSVLPRQALHAKSLGFTHPKTGEKMFFDSDLPQDMAAAFEKWHNYVQSR